LDQPGLTIGTLARAAGVGIETIRYYQRRGLLPVPVVSPGSFRRYPAELVERIRFTKRAQDLGFSLDQILELFALEDGHDRQAIRRIAAERRGDIEHRIEDLQRMQSVLSHLIHECEGSSSMTPCPIIATLSGRLADPAGASASHRPGSPDADTAGVRAGPVRTPREKS
jgi:Hg(II)-responsive transcriptional regulator